MANPPVIQIDGKTYYFDKGLSLDWFGKDKPGDLTDSECWDYVTLSGLQPIV